MNSLIYYIEQTDSTSNYLKHLLANGVSIDNLYTIYTSYQTAGRGQSGNSWESEWGENLLFSTILKPNNLLITEQFKLSMVVSLAVLEGIDKMCKELSFALPISIKWPNDIYVGDKKLVGILIENYLLGSVISSAVVGIGINVNQTEFKSSAPNPVSLKQLTNIDWNLQDLLISVHNELNRLLPMTNEPKCLKTMYMERLYRKDGYYPYIEREVSVAPTKIVEAECSQQFFAKIEDVSADGCLLLKLQDNTIRRYHFKQIQYVIPQTR